MSWDEFCTLLAGLNGDTSLGRIVAIRAEDDPDELKKFTKEQRRIRNEWRGKHCLVSENDTGYDAAINSFASVFKKMAKKGG